jgi:hypothetical protein
MTDARALRYRRLALAEQDPDAARLLRQIADEAEQGVLCVPEWHCRKGPPPVAIGTEPKP